MTVIHDGDGNEIADIPLSEKQQGMLDVGENIVVIYHTPQMLRGVLGQQNGNFMLTNHQGRIVVNNAGELRAYADMQRAIKAVREKE